MWEHNDGHGESNILQNQFTSYLAKAISRKKRRYQQKKEKQQSCEISLEGQEYLTVSLTESDLLEQIDQLDNPRLQQALRRQSERDLYIFYAKVLCGYSFVEISKMLEIDYKAVTAAYYRLVTRIRKELWG